MPRDARKLKAFSMAHELVIDVYRLTEAMPASEQFGLQSQIRRCAVSVPANLVEGAARQTPAEYRRFVGIAAGSASELRYLLDLGTELGLLDASASEGCRKCSDRLVGALLKLHQSIAPFADAAH